MKRSWILLIVALMLPARSAAAVPPVDDARAAAAGIRKLPGKRLTLYTDLSGPEIDRLPAIFDQAFPQWCRYFGVKEKSGEVAHYRLPDEEQGPFAAAGLLPGNLPPFTTRLLPAAGQDVLAARTAERFLSPRAVPARRNALLHVHGIWQRRPAVVRGGNGRIPGHASVARRPADARLHAAQPRGIAVLAEGSASFKTPWRSGGRCG